MYGLAPRYLKRPGMARDTLDATPISNRDELVAWMEDDTPLHVVLDARSGAVLDD